MPAEGMNRNTSEDKGTWIYTKQSESLSAKLFLESEFGGKGDKKAITQK